MKIKTIISLLFAVFAIQFAFTQNSNGNAGNPHGIGNQETIHVTAGDNVNLPGGMKITTDVDPITNEPRALVRPSSGTGNLHKIIRIIGKNEGSTNLGDIICTRCLTCLCFEDGTDGPITTIIIF